MIAQTRFVVAVAYDLPDTRSGVEMFPVDATDARTAGAVVLQHLRIPEFLAFALLEGEADFASAETANIEITSIVPISDLAGVWALPVIEPDLTDACVN